MAKKETCPNCGHNPRTDHVLMKAEIAALTRQLSQRDARIKELEEEKKALRDFMADIGHIVILAHTLSDPSRQAAAEASQ